MTLTDVIMRDLAIARRERECQEINKELDAYDRAVRRRFLARKFKSAFDVLKKIVSVAAWTLIVAGIWGCIFWATF